MVQLHLVEEDALAGARVSPDALRALTDAQPELGPLAGHPGIRAGLLNDRPLVSMEELLPGDVDALAEVAHVHQFLALERLDDLLVEHLADLATVQQRSLALILGRDHTEEKLAKRPAGEVRALVVEEDHLVVGVGRRVVDPLAGLLGREVSVLAEQLTGNRGSDGRERRSAGERKAAE